MRDRVVLLVDGKVASDTTVTDEDQVLELDALGVVRRTSAKNEAEPRRC